MLKVELEAIHVGDQVEIRHIYAWDGRTGRALEVRTDVVLVEVQPLAREDDQRTMRLWLPRLALKVKSST